MTTLHNELNLNNEKPELQSFQFQNIIEFSPFYSDKDDFCFYKAIALMDEP